jgi:ATP-dependent Clp protease ATP-binding subunit ClpC
MLVVICQRLKDQHDITLEIDDHVKEYLSEEGYKPEFGARELRRTVERLLEARIAEKLLRYEKVASPVCWRATRTNDAIVIEVTNCQC